MAPGFITTAEVPSQFLEAAYLVGSVPRIALASEPRVSYSLYIPPRHYNPNPLATAGGDASLNLPKLPLLIFMHGSKRNVSPIHNELIPFAESTPCAVLAPVFPAGLDGPNDMDSYKRLRSKTLRSDLALLSMLDEVAHRWPGIDTTRVFLMGYSGGGQFAHRFLYLYPERLAAVSIGAPGSVTVLDPTQKWPAGVADVEELFDRSIDKHIIQKVAIYLIVGSADVEMHGGEGFWQWYTKTSAKLRTGENDGMNRNKHPVQDRLSTLKRLHAMWMEDGIKAQLEIVEGVAHENGRVLGHVLQFLQPLMRKQPAVDS